LDLELGELVEIAAAVPGGGASGVAIAGDDVGDEAEARRAVAEGGAEDRHVALVALVDDAVLALGAAVFVEVLAHDADEFAAGVGAGLHLVEDLLRRLVADAQLFLVDQRVVDSIEGVLAELAVEQAALELVLGDVVLEAEGLEKILIDDV